MSAPWRHDLVCELDEVQRFALDFIQPENGRVMGANGHDWLMERLPGSKQKM